MLPRNQPPRKQALPRPLPRDRRITPLGRTLSGEKLQPLRLRQLVPTRGKLRHPRNGRRSPRDKLVRKMHREARQLRLRSGQRSPRDRFVRRTSREPRPRLHRNARPRPSVLPRLALRRRRRLVPLNRRRLQRKKRNLRNRNLRANSNSIAARRQLSVSRHRSSNYNGFKTNRGSGTASQARVLAP